MGAVAPEMLLGAQFATNAAGTYSQAQALKGQASFERGQLYSNAAMAKLQGQDAKRRGEIEAQRHLQATRGLIGAQRVAYAGQGVELGSGSPAEVMAETAGLGARDAQQIRQNSFLEALGFRSQAQQYRSQASFTKLAVRNQVRNSILSSGLYAARDAMGYASLKNIQPGQQNAS